MLSIKQQEQVEEIVIGLEIFNHPIEQIFTSAKDFRNPSRETVGLYVDIYSTYPSEDLYEINYYLSNIIEIRDTVNQDLHELGFTFDLNNLYEGLSNFSIFIDEISYSHRFDSEESKRNKEISESCYTGIDIAQKERRLVSIIDNTIIETRTYILDRKAEFNLNDIINKLNTEFKLCGLSDFSESNEVQIQTKPHLEVPHISERTSFSIESGNCSRSISIKPKLNILFNILRFLDKKDEFYSTMEAFKPSPEMFTQLEEDKKLYGAKGAHLRFLKSFSENQATLIQNHLTKSTVQSILGLKAFLEGVDEINEENATDIFQKIMKKTERSHISGLDFALLPSIEVDIELYKSWRSGEDIDSQLEGIYKNALEKLYQKPEKKNDYDEEYIPDNSTGLIVRSSAVNSEDSEQTSGAGIYESIGEIRSSSDFSEAVKKVFQSVDSNKAIAHRKEYGIEEEFMGLVIMPYIHASDSNLGYTNTSRIGKPHLLDIKDMRGKLVTLEKDLLPVDFENEMCLGEYISQFYNLDTWSDDGFKISDMGLHQNLPLMFFMEQYFGNPLQFEFVSSGSGISDDNLHIVQMRPLNYSDISTDLPEFPQEDHIYEGRCVIPGDIIMDTNDLLIEHNSYQATLSLSHGGSPLDHLSRGRYKAVIITNGFSVNSGHIETLCTEKGIICICDNPAKKQDRNTDFRKFDKVRVVSDGEIARVYAIEEE